jgi:hypothetical protein
LDVKDLRPRSEKPAFGNNQGSEAKVEDTTSRLDITNFTIVLVLDYLVAN